MKYLLDTNICIYIINQASEALYRRFRKLVPGSVGVSAITCCELEFGAANSSKPAWNRQVLAEFLAPLHLAAFPVEAAGHYGALRKVLKDRGRPVGAMDLLIAAHALTEGWTLVTNNEKEFRRIPGLAVENWARE